MRSGGFGRVSCEAASKIVHRIIDNEVKGPRWSNPPTPKTYARRGFINDNKVKEVTDRFFSESRKLEKGFFFRHNFPLCA